MANTSPTRKFLTTTEVAATLDTSAETVRRWARRGLLRASRPTPTSPLRFNTDDVDALAAQLKA